MTADPVILVLEDERAQILTLRSQLSGLGKLAEFMDPEPALNFLAAGNVCDAAIVDVRMPRSKMDGLEFLRAVRRFDRDLAIIIRTANDSDEIADQAIELRAIKRAVKSKTTLAELRHSVQEAVRETRERRETTRNARDASQVKTRLAEALGAYDLRLAAAEVHRGLVHAMRNQLTALSAMASVLDDDAARSGNAAFVEHAARTSKLVGRMVDSVNAFLDGPFGESSAASRAAVNVCMGALRQFFKGVQRWAGEGKRLAPRDLLNDTYVPCAPLELMNGLRHLVEFFFERAPAGAVVSLTAGILRSAEQIDERLGASACVLNREVVRRDRPYVHIRAAGPLPKSSVDEVRESFALRPESGRTGNLNVLDEVVSAARGAVLLSRQPTGVFTVEILLPVAL
jgi:CheY-like chemotaxis protein